MSRIIRFLIAMAASVAFVSGLIAGCADFARAQDATTETGGWQPLPPGPAIAQPDKAAPPLQVAGCWSGEIDDDFTGVGSGFTFVVQKGKRIARGTLIGFSFSGGPSATHGITGTVNSRSYKLSLTRDGCSVRIRGTMSSGDLVGTYSLTKRCLGSKFAGTFDFAFDPSGTSCP